MEKIVLNIYPILLLVMTFFGAKRAKKGEVAEEFLSLSQSKLIQGYACVAVIIHHLTQQITKYGYVDKGFITIFNYIGILFTALFFFFSGYGLITSVYTKEDYLKTFVVKRFPTVLIPFWIINVLGVLLLTLGYGVRYTTGELLSDIFGLTLINSNGWFIIEIVFIYIFFYVFFSLIKKKDVAFVLLIIAVILLIAYSYFQGHDEGAKSHWFRGEWWYNSTITFVFGMFFARFKEKLTTFFNKHYKLLMVLSVVLLVVLFYVSLYMLIRYGYYVENPNGLGKYGKLATLISQMIFCIISVIFVLLLNMKITIGNRVLGFISKMSVELFLIHGYFVEKIFGSVRLNDVIRFAVVIALSIACTAVISPVIRWIVRKATGVSISKKKPLNNTLEAEIARKERQKRIKTLKILLALAAIIGVSAYIIIGLRNHIAYKKQYDEECRKLAAAKIGDEVLWGHFETNGKPGRERLTWIVVERSGDSVCLLTKEGIGGYWYNQKHEAISYEDSDIRAKLNSDEYMSMFSKYELSNVEEKDGDHISLLTVDEASKFFSSDSERQIKITEEARLHNTNVNTLSKVNEWDMKGYRSSWWWLRGDKGEASIYAPVVTVDGDVAKTEKEVNRTGGAVRPVIWVKCSVGN